MCGVKSFQVGEDAADGDGEMLLGQHGGQCSWCGVRQGRTGAERHGAGRKRDQIVQGLERTWLFLSGARGTLWVSEQRCGLICFCPHRGMWNGDDRPAIGMSALRLGPHIRFTGEPGFAPASVWLPVPLTADLHPKRRGGGWPGNPGTEQSIQQAG